MTDAIVFQVDTSRVLKILAREIYDSPMAMLRENVQNAYDAVRQRFVRDGVLTPGGRIDIEIGGDRVSITDNGIGMTEEVLSSNFWKAGSSGKHSDAARKAGVVGTFGIGAMANFGVCTRLVVETRAEGRNETLRSTADRASLKIAEPCISLERPTEQREVGTTVTALLDPDSQVTSAQARTYLDQFVALLPVPVRLNGEIISQQSIESRLPLQGRAFTPIGTRDCADGLCGGAFEVRVDANGQVLVYVRSLTLAGNAFDGEIALVQSGGQVNGLRWRFGLAPIPAAGHYQLGGIANLSFLQPTAGREALSRESIEQVARFIGLCEHVASELLASIPAADNNTAFLQWLHAHGRYDLATKVTVHVLPEDEDVELGQLAAHIGARKAHFYTGTDRSILTTFANDSLCLVQIAQSNPRRAVQLNHLRSVLRLEQVPDAAQVTRRYGGPDLSVAEASLLVRAASVLREDYLIPEAEVVMADISHGVAVLPQKSGETVRIYLAKDSRQVQPILECFAKAYDVFYPVVKDFVRVHLYPAVQQYVPSSTRQGVDALRKVLQRNRELYRYEEAERGDLEGVLGEYLSGEASLTQVIQVARVAVKRQSQRVSSGQVGTIETVVPGVVESPVQQEAGPSTALDPAPPIIRDDVSSDMKILTASGQHPQLNNFTMLLGLSDKLMKEYSDFFRLPHTTRILWGGHRVIYILTEATGRLSVYYDIQLKDAISGSKASGGMFPTTTLVTRKRIFVPVPDVLTEVFRVTSGAKEFFVKFDVLTTDAV